MHSSTVQRVCVPKQRTVALSAGKRTMIKVSVGKPNQTVRLSGAGIKQSQRSNKQGIAEFKLTPRSSGSAKLSVDNCALRSHVSVNRVNTRPRTHTTAAPKFTG